MKGFVSMIVACLMLVPGVGESAELTGDLEELGRGQAYYLKFIKVYDAVLYGEQRAGAEGILSQEISKCLQLMYVVDVGRDDFIEAAETVLARQLSRELPPDVKEGIDTLHANYRDVQEGDSYTLCYDSSLAETTLLYNGDPLVEIRSPAFSRVYFGIWLGGVEPLDEKLRDSLLADYQYNTTPPGVL